MLCLSDRIRLQLNRKRQESAKNWSHWTQLSVGKKCSTWCSTPWPWLANDIWDFSTLDIYGLLKRFKGNWVFTPWLGQQSASSGLFWDFTCWTSTSCKFLIWKELTSWQWRELRRPRWCLFSHDFHVVVASEGKRIAHSGFYVSASATAPDAQVKLQPNVITTTVVSESPTIPKLLVRWKMFLILIHCSERRSQKLSAIYRRHHFWAEKEGSPCTHGLIPLFH